MWSLGRVLIEDSQARSTPTSEQDFTEREVLTLKLLEQFPGQVTETTLRKTFDLHYSQVGQMVKRLSEGGLLEKHGRGKPIELTAKGVEAAEKLQVTLGLRFAYAFRSFKPDDFRNLSYLLRKMYGDARKQVENRLFDRPIDAENVFGIKLP